MKYTNKIKKHSRIFVKNSLFVNAKITLNTEQSHYLKNVMRLKVNDKINIFNRESEWIASISNISSVIEIQVESFVKYESNTHAIEIIALICPIKNKRMQIMIEKMTEIGIDTIIFIRSKNTIISDLNIKKVQSWIYESIEQSEQISPPRIAYLNSNNHNGQICCYVEDNNLNKLHTLSEAIQIISKEAVIIFDRNGKNLSEIFHNNMNININQQQTIVDQHEAHIKKSINENYFNQEYDNQNSDATYNINLYKDLHNNCNQHLCIHHNENIKEKSEESENINLQNINYSKSMYDNQNSEAFVKIMKHNKRVFFIIGPEGGFSSDEMLKISNTKNILHCNLNKNNLRAETAAIIATHEIIKILHDNL